MFYSPHHLTRGTKIIKAIVTILCNFQPLIEACWPLHKYEQVLHGFNYKFTKVIKGLFLEFKFLLTRYHPLLISMERMTMNMHFKMSFWRRLYNYYSVYWFQTLHTIYKNWHVFWVILLLMSPYSRAPTLKWLKYCRYDIKQQSINQSIFYKIGLLWGPHLLTWSHSALSMRWSTMSSACSSSWSLWQSARSSLRLR